MTELEPYRRPLAPEPAPARSPWAGLGVIASGGLFGVAAAGALVVSPLVLIAAFIAAMPIVAALAVARISDNGATIERSAYTRITVNPRRHDQ